MLRFIYFCMAIVALSFLIVPLFSGVNQSRQDLAARTSLMASTETTNEIDLDAMAAQLNAVETAAGDQSSIPALPEEFSAEFEPNQHPAF